MEVAKITEQLAQDIKETYIGNSSNWKFNPVRDCSGNWIVSLPEAVSGLQESQYDIISWCPPIIDDDEEF